jgi:hypothetical protein
MEDAKPAEPRCLDLIQPTFQTLQASVAKPYAPAAAIDRWPAAAKASTEFAVQYGLKDLLAPPGQVVDLMTKLKGANLLKVRY